LLTPTIISITNDYRDKRKANVDISFDHKACEMQGELEEKDIWTGKPESH
jgi:hypothetical protein